MALSPEEYVRLEGARLRRTYLVALGVPALLVLGTWLTVGAPNPFLRVVFPVLLAYHGVLALGLATRRLPLAVAGPLVVLSPVLIVFTRLLLWRLGALPGLDDAVAVALWSIAVLPLTFVVFGTRRGLQVSLALYLGLLALLGPPAVEATGPGPLDAPTAMALHLLSVGAVVLALLWLLASRLERFVALRARADLLALQATTDPLTGLANRRSLEDGLEQLIPAAQRYGQPLSLVLIDLDHFKQVNDRLGHEIGDRVLVEAVERMAATVREADLLGRWGGEEFLLLAPHTDHDAACALAERCRRALAGAPLHGVEATASLGVATLGPTDEARRLLRRADLALYMAKGQGRNRVVGLTASDDPAPDSPSDARGDPVAAGAAGRERPGAPARGPGSLASPDAGRQTMSQDDQPRVIRNEATGRFELDRAPETAHLVYEQADGRLRLIHTEVGDELEGQGVGSALVREALAHAEAQGLTVVPECGFVSSWLERHPDRAAELDVAEP